MGEHSVSGTSIPAPIILLVDDSDDTRELYREHLTSVGFRVTEAPNGAEALMMAASFPPDLIVMDLAMPVMNGVAATRALKSDARTRGIPIIACSGSMDFGEGQRAMEAGCERLVPKPCLPDELERIVRETLEAHADRRREA